MAKKLIFIGDDHTKDGCILFGVQTLGQLKPNSYILLLEEEVSNEPIRKDEFEDTRAIIIKDKINSADALALENLMANAYAVYGFDGKGPALSLQRHASQKKNITDYVNHFKTYTNIEKFIVIVGDGHLNQRWVKWEPLQEATYGDDIENMYSAALVLYAT
ncbi:hypothetical protein [Paraburkholderia sp. J10-1]|uniref:hypothetical protein n=1 Tax=Paraburkholderia sp. J10-1 TaxID=2805430 RepID=UPI002AB77EA4|nr:hypothetical protein [Paraburkholderia sp. J10-1]